MSNIERLILSYLLHFELVAVTVLKNNVFNECCLLPNSLLPGDRLHLLWICSSKKYPLYFFWNDITKRITIFIVRKTAKIRKRYNLVSHLTQDTTWEINKNTIYITNKSQDASPFPACDHKAAMNRRESMGTTRHKKHK